MVVIAFHCKPIFVPEFNLAFTIPKYMDHTHIVTYADNYLPLIDGDNDFGVILSLCCKCSPSLSEFGSSTMYKVSQAHLGSLICRHVDT